MYQCSYFWHLYIVALRRTRLYGTQAEDTERMTQLHSLTKALLLSKLRFYSEVVLFHLNAEVVSKPLYIAVRDYILFLTSI